MNNSDRAQVFGQGRRIVRVGHRGAAGHAPENTLAAIRQGIKLGADFIEVDVHRTLDGCLVLIHDSLLDRTTSGSGFVTDTSWDELRLLDAGRGERVPCVQSALTVATGGVGMVLEIKAEGIARDLARVVQDSEFAGPVIYASFMHNEILDIRKMDPEAKTMALMEPLAASGAVFACDAKADYVGIAQECVTAEYVAALHAEGLQVWTYTVNDPRLIARSIELGVDGVISDYPERVPKRA